MKSYGLIGKNISYTFSEKFFQDFFKNNKIQDSNYKIYDIENLSNIRSFIFQNNIIGLNVTIPYKENILNYVDELSDEVKEIGACNTLLIKNKVIKAFNTDIFGFEQSNIDIILKSKKNLIIGTGGASKAVEWIFKKYNLEYEFLSREKKGKNIVSYDILEEKNIYDYDMIVNCTPVGTYPNVEQYPNINYKKLKKDVFLVDLVYNPIETMFMKLGKNNGAMVRNGIRMLELQAKKSWEIWNR